MSSSGKAPLAAIAGGATTTHPQNSGCAIEASEESEAATRNMRGRRFGTPNMRGVIRKICRQALHSPGKL